MIAGLKPLMILILGGLDKVSDLEASEAGRVSKILLAHFGSPIEEKVSDLRGLEGLESLEMHGFSGLRSSDAGSPFGGPIEEKVSDLGGLEGLEGLEMHGFSGLEGVSDSA